MSDLELVQEMQPLKFTIPEGKDWISLTEKNLMNKTFYNPHQPLKDRTYIYYSSNMSNKKDVERNMEFVQEMINQYNLLQDYYEISANEDYKQKAFVGKEITGGFLTMLDVPKKNNHYHYNQWAVRYFNNYLQNKK